MPSGRGSSMLFLLLTSALAAQPTAAAVERPRLRAVRLEAGEGIALDGRLDEPAWARCPTSPPLHQREPAEGQAATEATDFRILFDDKALYVGVRALDREPAKVIARILQRDKLMEPSGFDASHGFAGDDAIAVLLDPWSDGRNAVVFATNPNGAEFDALISDEGAAMNADWRGVWSVRARKSEDGWSAELRIPFRTLRYPDGAGRAWGFNLYRVIRRKNEHALLASFTRDGGGFHRVSRAGVIEGIEPPRQRLNVEVKPYGLSGVTGERAESGVFQEELDGALGLDAKWELRPGLVLDATLNPDFAQVEADEQRINLTRFDLFFPEKRDFFLENAGIFDFGFKGFGEPPPFLLFFSRRIGIVEDEGEAPVRWGARLTGRAGAQTLGLLHMTTGPAFGEPGRQWSVARLKRDVAGNGYVGAIAADRRGATDSNSAFGADASLWPMKTLNIQAFAARTTASGKGGEGTAYRAGIDYSGDRLGIVASHLLVGPGAKAEMGFVTRDDIRRTDLFGRVTLRPALLGLRKIDIFGGGQYVSRADGERQDWSSGPFAALEWNSGDSVAGFYSRVFNRIDEAFDLEDRVTVSAGDYHGSFAGVFLNTSRNRPWSIEGTLFRQRNFGGRLQNASAALTLTPSARVNLRLGVAHNKAELPGGSFAGEVYSLRCTYSFSTRLTASAFVQRNTLDDEWITNLRLAFIHRPGSDLFLVLNEERSPDAFGRSRPASRAAALKLTYLVRF